jgi:glycine cleavage system H protein
MSIPADLKYTPSHEWVRVEADGTLTVGITHHAQDLLGDMVFIVNKDAYAAWMFKLKPANPADVAELLDAAAYQKLVESEAH